jgi:Glucose dehydrogenase
MPEVYAPRTRTGFEWYAVFIGFVLLAIGLVLAAGGVWLISLGGSWYYAITGVLLVICGVLLCQKRRSGVMLFVAVWLGTLIWAIWEVTLDGWEPASDWWALEPRVFAPTVMLVLVLIALPVLRPRRLNGVTAVVATALLGLSLAMGGSVPLYAQQDHTPKVQQKHRTRRGRPCRSRPWKRVRIGRSMVAPFMASGIRR